MRRKPFGGPSAFICRQKYRGFFNETSAKYVFLRHQSIKVMLAKLRLLLPSLILLTFFACMWGGSTQPEQAPTTGFEAKKTPAPQIVLAELFTSQGCSSCPPADAVLQRLAADHQNGELPVIALSYHVDYWNRLGWRDPYSDAAFSERQRQYAHNWSLMVRAVILARENERSETPWQPPANGLRV